LRDRIGDLHEHDRHGAGGLLDHRQVRRGSGQDHVRHQPDQLRSIDACEFGITGVPANVDAEILAFGPSQLAESLDKGRHIRLRCGLRRGAVHEHADPPHLIRLLRARRERPCCRRAAEKGDEVAPFHAINS
jgi:hypothetical protein